MTAKTAIRKKKNMGRSTDLSLAWITEEYGDEWSAWRKLASEWLMSMDKGLSKPLASIGMLIDCYLAPEISWASDVTSFFKGHPNTNALPTSDALEAAILKRTNQKHSNNLKDSINTIVRFIDWITEEKLVEIDDDGVNIKLFSNPFSKKKRNVKTSETVHSPLPYRYVCELRKILCSKAEGHFSDWLWAYNQNGSNGVGWFEVEPELIDKDDPDCVWRVKEVTKQIRGEGRKNKEIYELWSPVKAMVVFVKLHLPLRTYQVRMLDSGEADDYRFNNGEWVKNTENIFALKGRKKGVFRRFVDNATGFESTGLYINTNKTADQNKDELEHGYDIPWQNEDVLYWLEKLRNWQEKYNPIKQPTDCITLTPRHTRTIKSDAQLASMGSICFLMRDASARNIDDRHKPVTDNDCVSFWYNLLEKFEQNLLSDGVTLSDGTSLEFVHKYPSATQDAHKKKTHFPLHSLRVSLITSYIIEGKIPAPVVSKLLAGHSRLLMTLYYTKITPAVMSEKMSQASKAIDGQSEASIRSFLKDAELRQIKCKVAYNSESSIEDALVNRNPIGWEKRHHGLCLVGGNTAKTSENKSVGGCWNGGALLSLSKTTHSIYNSVPHGPENCVRCRWFVTDARYLPALNAHLNFMSYKAHEAANLAVKLEGDIEKMEEHKYEAEIEGKPFIKHNELQALQRRYEKQIVEADEYAKDWIATFNLIRRLIEIEQGRVESDTSNKLIAAGSESDIKVGFMETDSELLQLSLLCEDAEFYPDMLDDVKKTPTIERRTQSLSRFMMRKGYMPQLLMLDQEQQLIAANAMMRQMALQANPTDKLDGYNQVANYLELGQFMHDNQLLESGINALEKSINTPIDGISIKSLTNDLVKGELLNAG